jgi:hypothetical protein
VGPVNQSRYARGLDLGRHAVDIGVIWQAQRPMFCRRFAQLSESYAVAAR